MKENLRSGNCTDFDEGKFQIIDYEEHVSKMTPSESKSFSKKKHCSVTKHSENNNTFEKKKLNSVRLNSQKENY